jgi:methyl-accepting chemotaxis protein
MLNNLKIGTKLTGGFIIILGLLCVTAGVGYFALKSSTSATEEMMKDEAVLIDITQLRGNFVESQFQLADAALYRKLSNKEEKKTLDEQIREIEERIKGGFKDEDEKTFAKLLEAYDNFYKSGTKWFEKEEERAKTHGAQTTLGGNVEKGMDNYIDAFTKAMEETKTNEGGTEKVSHEYAILSMELGKLRADIEALRRGYYRLLAEADSQKQAAIKTEIDASAGNLEKALEAFEGKIKNEDRRKMFGTVRTSVHDWLETFRKNASLMEEQGTILSDQNARVKEMRELLTTLSGSVEKDVKKIKAATEDTNTLAFNIVFGSAVVAVIIGMILAYVLSSNITVAIKAACAGVERIAHDGDVAWEVPEVFLRRGDEMGTLAKSVSHILHEIQSVEKLAHSLAEYD